MAAGCFSGSGISKYRNSFLYYLKEGHVSSLNGFEEGLSFGLDGLGFGILSHRCFLYFL